MTNREKFGDKVLDVLEREGTFAVSNNGKVCGCDDILGCNNCLSFVHWRECEYYKAKWLREEYKYYVTENELKFVNILDTRYHYIARDKNGLLFLYNKKPEKRSDAWVVYYADNLCAKRIYTEFCENVNFSMVKWEDDEPWEINKIVNLPVENIQKGEFNNE